jgi:hypothetical protein
MIVTQNIFFIIGLLNQIPGGSMIKNLKRASVFLSVSIVLISFCSDHFAHAGLFGKKKHLGADAKGRIKHTHTGHGGIIGKNSTTNPDGSTRPLRPGEKVKKVLLPASGQPLFDQNGNRR